MSSKHEKIGDFTDICSWLLDEHIPAMILLLQPFLAGNSLPETFTITCDAVKLAMSSDNHLSKSQKGFALESASNFLLPASSLCYWPSMHLKNQRHLSIHFICETFVIVTCMLKNTKKDNSLKFISL